MPKPKHGKLKDIRTTEVSMVDSPANKLPFLFFKRDGTNKTQFTNAKKKITIEIESNGTAKGTKISVNGDKLGEVRDFSFYFYGNDAQSPVSCSYSKVVESDDGFKRTETYYLSKGETVMNSKTLESLKAYFGEKDVDVKKKVEEDAIEKALVLITKHYKESFPEDLENAVGILAINACCSEVKEDVEKAGAKFSKDAIKKINAVIAAVEALKSMTELKNPTEKADDAESEGMAALTKQLAELKEVIAGTGSEKKDEDNPVLTKLTQVVEKIATRVEAMEKAGVVKTSLEEQENEETPKVKGAGEGGKVLWKSLHPDS